MQRICLLMLFTASFLSADEATVRGFRMHYESRGKGQAIVFLHGFSLDSREWADQLRHFSRKYRVIAPDTRLHGRSAIPPLDTKNSLDEMVADIIALLDHLKIQRAHLVGHSMGGSFALEVALQHPERVRSLTLVAAGIQGTPVPPEAMAGFMKGLEAYKSEGAAGFRRVWIEDPLLAPAVKDPQKRKQVAEMIEDFKVDAMMKMSPPPAPARSQLDRLSEVKVPTLVMIGEKDQPHIIKAADSAAERIPGAKKIAYPEVGHMINMEQPESFNRDLQKFLDGLPRQ